MPAPSPVLASQPQAPRCSRLSRICKRLADDVVRLAVLEVDDEADAAGIVLVLGVVQTLLRGVRGRVIVLVLDRTIAHSRRIGDAWEATQLRCVANRSLDRCSAACRWRARCRSRRWPAAADSMKARVAEPSSAPGGE